MILEKYCHHCYSPVEVKDMFCPECGTKQKPDFQRDTYPGQSHKSPYWNGSQYSNNSIVSFYSDIVRFYSQYPQVVWGLFIIMLVILLAVILHSLPISTLIIFNACLVVVYFLPNLLRKVKLLPSTFDLRTILSSASIGRTLTIILIGIVELVILYFVMVNSVLYKDYTFRSLVDEYVENNDEGAIKEYFTIVSKNESVDSIYYIIDASLKMRNQPLTVMVENSFQTYSDSLKNKIISAYIQNKSQLFSPKFIADEMFRCSYRPEQILAGIILTHHKDSLQYFSAKNLVEMVDQSVELISEAEQNFSLPKYWSSNLDNHGDRMIEKISGYINHFKLVTDSLWKGISKEIRTLDTLREFYSDLDTDLPIKPTLDPVPFSKPVYLSGAIMPYDGYGMLITDFSRFYLIQGAERFPGYFEGYVDVTDEIETIIIYSNQSKWDAIVCNYVSTEEYNRRVESYNRELLEEQEGYNSELGEYRDKLAEYQKSQQLIPVVLKSMMHATTSIVERINKIRSNGYIE